MESKLLVCPLSLVLSGGRQSCPYESHGAPLSWITSVRGKPDLRCGKFFR
jgi:hypothetical protein